MEANMTTRVATWHRAFLRERAAAHAIGECAYWSAAAPTKRDRREAARLNTAHVRAAARERAARERLSASDRMQAQAIACGSVAA